MYKIFFTLAIIFFSLESYSAKLLQNYGKWGIFKITRIKDNLCYIVGEPSLTEANYRRKHSSFVIFTKYGNEIEFSASAGVNFQEKTVFTNITTEKYELYGHGKTLWLKELNTDSIIYKALEDAEDLEITYDFKEKSSKDVYSHNGFKEAIKYLRDVCN